VASPTRPTSSGLHTGDSILDELIEQRRVTAAQEQDTFVLTCPFASDLPFALAPAFVLCEVQNGQAILRYDKAAVAGPDVTGPSVPEPDVTESSIIGVTVTEPASAEPDVTEQCS